MDIVDIHGQQRPIRQVLALEGHTEELFPPLLTTRKQARLITLEEHAVTPFDAGVAATSTTQKLFQPEFLAGLKDRLGNIKKRIEIMDANNIGAQIISLNQPTVQAIVDLDEAIAFCRKANQWVYENYVQAYPERFFAFAALPTQNGKAAAAELERCVKEYGFVGALINGYTNTDDPTVGLYLDDPQFDALWEVAERLQKPIFIHPRVPIKTNLKNLEDLVVLHGNSWGFGRDTVEHVLRIMTTGVFDRFPKLKIVLGHMGEGLSFMLPRTDSAFRMYTKEAQGPKKRRFLEYFQDNIVSNTSGHPSTSAFLNLLAEAKLENVVFSVDYPYESIAEVRGWFETVPISDETWKDIGYRNAIKLFNLPLQYD